MRRRFVLGLVAAATVACGKQGPPLPPLHLVPGPVTDVVVRRTVDDVRFTFVLPAKNANGPGDVTLERVDVFGATVAAGAVAPSNRELMVPKFLVGSVTTRPPAKDKGKDPEDPPATTKDSRPGPGDAATVVETLDAAKRQPAFTAVEPSPAAAAKPPAQPAAAAAAATPKVTRRVYVIRPVARGGRPGQPAGRVEVPLIDPPPAPAAAAAKFTPTAVTIGWTFTAVDFVPTVQYNVYVADAHVPLNATPLAEPSFERAGVEFGKEECFVVRAVAVVGGIQIEGPPSEPACVTPADIFPPAAPRGLAAVAGTGVISLIWDANSEPDLAGYLVLRGEVPGDKLQALTPSPIKETTFRDTTVTAGVRYVYAIVAVDRATPPNTSGQSTRVEETAR